MNKVYFAIGLHFHQPVGNFEHIFERAYELCYKPFVELLSNHPDIKMSFHISGSLLDYLDKRHPQTIELIKNMVLRNQVEMISGAYYEPILTVIPERDLIGQISMMSEYIKNRLGFIPTGMWIPERVWESRLIKPIYDTGIRYAILDDYHVLRSGIKKEDMHGYFLTGGDSQKLAIFPSDKNLRYKIPFTRHPNQILDYFKSVAEGRKGVFFTYGDDAEKFGEWPGTHDWVYAKGWLRDFFDMLNENYEWIEMVKFSDYLRDNDPMRTVEISPSSYEEMMDWSDGSWINFLTKYPETNQMHKKMVYISDKIAKIKNQSSKSNSQDIEEAKRELYKGQCNDGYWHGVFGGLYLFHLRNAIYKHLIAADKITDDMIHKRSGWLDIKRLDSNSDSENKILMVNKTFSLYLDADDGGVLKELDYRPLSLNLINTLSRKEESYHQKIIDSIPKKKKDKFMTIHDNFRVLDPLLERKLIYDRFPRYCLRNYFLQEDVKMRDFINSSFQELGDFATGTYTVKKITRSLILQRRSKVSNTILKLIKQIQIKSEKEIEILYSIKNEGSRVSDIILGIEFNVTMPYLNSDRYNYFCDGKNIGKLNARGSAPDVSSFGISDSDKELGINLKFQRNPIEIWFFPIETISQSERAYELNYQCSCIFPRWKPVFDKSKSWDLKISWFII